MLPWESREEGYSNFSMQQVCHNPKKVLGSDFIRSMMHDYIYVYNIIYYTCIITYIYIHIILVCL